MKYASVALKIAAAAGALFSTAASATPSLMISGNTVSGFIPLSDVQFAHQFTDAMMQRYASHVIFAYSDHLTIDYTCGATAFVQEVERSGTLQDSYDGVAKAGSSSPLLGTGWTVSGTLRLSGGSGFNTLPQIGDSCPLNSRSGTVTSVDMVSSERVLTVSVPSRGMDYLDPSGIIVQ